MSLDAFRQLKAAPPGGQPPTGGDPPTELDYRVAALEKSVEKIDGKLDKIIETQASDRLTQEQRFGSIEGRLASIEGKLEAKASSADLQKIGGRVESLPTTWQMITLVFGIGILGGAFLILKFGLPHAP